MGEKKITKQISSIIAKKYNRQNQCLKLSKCHKNWTDVLQSQNWTNLKILHLNQCQVQDNQIKVLSEMEWPNLQELHLKINEITGKGLQALLQNRWPKLHTLKISQNKLLNEDIKYVIEHKNTLRVLDLGMNDTTDMGCFFTMIPKDLPSSNLIQLNLSFNCIGNRGIKQLVKYSMPNLQNLHIQGCSINDEGSKHLSKAKWPNIKNIFMQQNDVMYHGLNSLQMYNIQNLNLLNVGNMDQIGNGQNDIDMISLMILVASINTNTMITPSNLNMDFLEDMERIIKSKFLVNMYG